MNDKQVKLGLSSNEYDITTSRVNFFTRYAYSNFEFGSFGIGIQYLNFAERTLDMPTSLDFSDGMMNMYVSNEYEVETMPHYCNLVYLQFKTPIEYYCNAGGINTYLIQGLTLWQNNQNGYANSFNIMHRYVNGRLGNLSDITITPSPENISDYYVAMMGIINQVVTDCETALLGYSTDYDDYNVIELKKEDNNILIVPQQSTPITYNPTFLEVINLHVNICYLYGFVYTICSSYGYSPDYSSALAKINNHIGNITELLNLQQQLYTVSTIPEMYSVIKELLEVILNQ